MPSAAGLSNFVRITAGAIGTSVFTTVWESRATLHLFYLSSLLFIGLIARIWVSSPPRGQASDHLHAGDAANKPNALQREAGLPAG